MFFACSEEQKDDAASIAAKEYYDALLAGKYDAFIRGTYLPDTIPSSYREQLETNAKMFMAIQKEEHNGINEVKVINCTHDTARHTADVFLVLCFGDSLNEEVVVPMIEHKGRWLMR